MEFLEIQRPVVQRAGQAEPVLDQHGLARAVALVHAADLRDRGVRFVNDQQVIAWGKNPSSVHGREPGGAAGQVPRVIFDAGAEAHLLHHLQVVFRAHLDALGLEQFAVLLEPGDALAQFLANGQQGAAAASARGVTNCLPGKMITDLRRLGLVPGQRLEAREPLDVVAEKLDAQRVLASRPGKVPPCRRARGTGRA